MVSATAYGGTASDASKTAANVHFQHVNMVAPIELRLAPNMLGPPRTQRIAANMGDEWFARGARPVRPVTTPGADGAMLDALCRVPAPLAVPNGEHLVNAPAVKVDHFEAPAGKVEVLAGLGNTLQVCQHEARDSRVVAAFRQ